MDVIFPSFEPPPDRGTVGVGQPIAVIFDQPPPDKAAAERALTVTTVPAVEGDGMYGETDRTLTLTIGPAKIATVDDATKIMTVTIDGQVAQQFPVSMGREESTTVNGEVISFVTPAASTSPRKNTTSNR